MLAEKPHVVLLTKVDLLGPGQPLPGLDAPDAAGVMAISSAAGQGIEQLKEYLWQRTQRVKQEESEDVAPWIEEEP
jgi:50S ribosomal subunit-associated GTPase HflX